jgi:hypothetical protein
MARFINWHLAQPYLAAVRHRLLSNVCTSSMGWLLLRRLLRQPSFRRRLFLATVDQWASMVRVLAYYTHKHINSYDKSQVQLTFLTGLAFQV